MKKILLYYHTLRQLKFRQILYQIIYGLKWTYFKHDYASHTLFSIPLDERLIHFPVFTSNAVYKNDLQFTFLNQSKQFDTDINWSFMGHGKLWNYHLQYMSYLTDESIPKTERLKFLRNLSNQIIDRKLKLEPYPISLRLINSLIFIQKHAIQEKNIDRAIAIQLNFLENNPEYHLMANHLFENYISLCFAYTILANEKKYKKYLELILEELEEQTFPDGAHYERSPAYHSQLLSRLLQLVFLIQKKNEYSIAQDDLELMCSRMLGWYQVITREGKYLPLFNDTSVSSTIGFQALFDLGLSCRILPRICSLKESGFRILSNDQIDLFINCGNVSPSYQPGHAHADMLHFILYCKGRLIFCDTGISTYENIPVRLIEKSTQMHNTVSVGEENQSQIWLAFRIAKRATVQILEENDTMVHAELVWFNGIKHERKFILEDNILIIEDTVSNLQLKEARPCANFHFDHRLNNQLQISDSKANLESIELQIDFSNSERIQKKEYLQAEDFNKQNEGIKISAYFAEYLKTNISWKQ